MGLHSLLAVTANDDTYSRESSPNRDCLGYIYIYIYIHIYIYIYIYIYQEESREQVILDVRLVTRVTRVAQSKSALKSPSTNTTWSIDLLIVLL